VLYQGLNNHTKFGGGSWLNSHEITAVYESDEYSSHLYCFVGIPQQASDCGWGQRGLDSAPPVRGI